MQQPLALYKARKDLTRMSINNLKKAVMWLSPDGMALNYAYKVRILH
jgi:hypothetical protein